MNTFKQFLEGRKKQDPEAKSFRGKLNTMSKSAQQNTKNPFQAKSVREFEDEESTLKAFKDFRIT